MRNSLLYEYNRLVSFSSSKAKINLHVKNQRRQDYLFQCETPLDDSKKGINAPPPQMTTATFSGDIFLLFFSKPFIVKYALFVTSKIEFSNCPILEFKVLQNAFQIKKQGLKCFLKS